MGLFTGIIGAAIEVVKTPLNITQDLLEGGENERTKEGLSQAAEDLKSTFDGDL